MATQKVLLLEDIGVKGRKGDIVEVKSGFARNWLFPRGQALRATTHAIRLQERLQEERRKQAAIDRVDAEKQAAHLEGKVYEVEVKVDQEGHMYGSVSTLDIQRLLKEQDGIEFDRRQIALPHPIKKIGVTEVSLRLKEGVTCGIKIKVAGEGVVATETEEVAAAPEGEEAAVEGGEASAEEAGE